jgi:hypothetical protein
VIEGGEEYTYTGARSIDHKSIDQREQEKKKKRTREREAIYIVIGGERQTSIFFLANVDFYDEYR